jgi:hypothetical protein
LTVLMDPAPEAAGVRTDDSRLSDSSFRRVQQDLTILVQHRKLLPGANDRPRFRGRMIGHGPGARVGVAGERSESRRPRRRAGQVMAAANDHRVRSGWTR